MGRQQKDGSFPGDARKSLWDDFDATTVQGAPGSFSWGDVDTSLLQKAVAAATECGDAISFANSRNNSSGSVTILSGPNRPRIYANNADQAESVLLEILKRYQR